MENLEPTINQILNDAENIFHIRGISSKLDSVLTDSREISDPRIIIDRMRVIKSKGEILHIKKPQRLDQKRIFWP